MYVLQVHVLRLMFTLNIILMPFAQWDLLCMEPLFKNVDVSLIQYIVAALSLTNRDFYFRSQTVPKLYTRYFSYGRLDVFYVQLAFSSIYTLLTLNTLLEAKKTESCISDKRDQWRLLSWIKCFDANTDSYCGYVLCSVLPKAAWNVKKWSEWSSYEKSRQHNTTALTDWQIIKRHEYSCEVWPEATVVMMGIFGDWPTQALWFMMEEDQWAETLTDVGNMKHVFIVLGMKSSIYELGAPRRCSHRLHMEVWPTLILVMGPRIDFCTKRSPVFAPESQFHNNPTNILHKQRCDHKTHQSSSGNAFRIQVPVRFLKEWLS